MTHKRRQHKTAKKQSNVKKTKRNQTKQVKRTQKKQRGRVHHPYRWQEQSGGSACGQLATISEPGIEIKSQITGKSGLVIPGSRALLSSSLPMGCNTGNHP